MGDCAGICYPALFRSVRRLATGGGRPIEANEAFAAQSAQFAGKMLKCIAIGKR